MTNPPAKRGRGRPRKVPLVEILPPADDTAPLPVSSLHPHDPTNIERWNPNLPVEVALGVTDDPEVVCKEYKLTPEEWYWLQRNPDFQEVCEQYREMIKTPDDEFRMKAKLLAGDHLKLANRMVRDPDVPPKEKITLMQTIFRMAGYDNKNEGAAVGNAVGLSIQINMGEK